MAAAKCKPFEITIKSEVADVYDDVVKKAKAAKLIIKGKPQKGTIKHTKFKVKGKYTSKGKTIRLEMEEDEYFDQCDRIESDFRKALKGL